MNKVLISVSCSLFIICLIGCISLRSRVKQGAKLDNSIFAGVLPAHPGSKAKIAILDFDVNAAKAEKNTGLGLREMLLTACANSNRFRIVEPQALNVVAEEKEAVVQGQGGNADAQSPAKPRAKPIGLAITATITEFEPGSSGGRAGIGGGGGASSGAFGGLLGASLNKAHIALDVRVVDVSTSEVIAASKILGQATDISGSIMTAFMGNWPLTKGLSAYANTPMEKAIRICIIETVRYISTVIPEKYYKH